MSLIQGNSIEGGAGYEIQKSLRFRASASAYLSRTPSVAGNRKTWTWSGWVKRGTLGSHQDLFISGSNVTSNLSMQISFSDTIRVYASLAGVSNDIFLVTSAVYSDPSAWYHVVVLMDTTQATASNRTKLYVNGSQVTAFSTATYSAQNYATSTNNTVAHTIGRFTNDYFDGYLSEINFIDGQALAPSYFGEFSAETGAWIPKKYTGAYGTNGFYLPFNDGSNLTNLTADRSGNGNNWTANNISLTSGVTYDWMTDTPTNNFAVLNPTISASTGVGAITNGNLQCVTPTSGASNNYGTVGVSSGKWYWEITATARTTDSHIMIGINDNTQSATEFYSQSRGYAYRGSGEKWNNGSGVAYGSPSATGDIIGVAFDADVGSIEFFRNGSSMGVAYTGITASTYFPAICDTGTTVSWTATANFGQRPFAYTPPAGFKALCTANLPAVAIPNPKKHFDVVLATGANIKSTVEALYSDQALMIVKDRANANNWQWFNDVTGLSAILQSNTTSAETTYSVPTGSSVGYGWKAGGAPVTNNAGSIQSQVSANLQAGFSIVTYTGTGANATVGHGLGVAPKFVIVKNRTSTGSVENWNCWHTSLGSAAYRILLNTTGATDTGAAIAWNSTAPTSTVFSIGTLTGVNTSGTQFVAYCFAEIPGFSKIDKYVGNGSADGPFVYCGFKPAFVLVKSSSAVGGWTLLDAARSPSNVAARKLQPASSAAETDPTSDLIDFTANGFKLRGTGADSNANGVSYIFIAFADVPFKYSNSR